MVDSILTYTVDPDEDFYTILGSSEISSVQQITTEYRIRALYHHPDKNPDNAESEAIFLKLQRAKNVLTDEKRRADYDKWRNSGMAISYVQWSSMKDSLKASMHWVSKKQHEPMIEAPATSSNNDSQSNQVPANTNRSIADSHMIGNVCWQRTTGNDLLRKFRNYEI